MYFYIVTALVLAVVSIYAAVKSREARIFLAGAFFVSSGIQFYLYFARVPVPLLGTHFIQRPVLSAVRGIVHFILFIICTYFGFAKRK